MGPFACSEIRSALTIGLVTHAQNDLGGTVVARHHVRSHEEAGGGRPSQTEVQDLQRTVRFHYYVTGLQILGSEEVRSQKLLVNFTINNKEMASNALN